MSDAGCPAVADPGMLLVALAHQHAIKVVPLVGPSSIVLGLMASGLNGQFFSFLGYLPQKKEDKIQKIKCIGALAHEQTFSCIETPYSNGKTLELFLQYLPSHLRLCIACDLTHTTQEVIQTKTIQAWRKNPPQDLHKRPTIFFIGV
jgi:16S rRNA (cytidine1402-2'-O)-methyltransferase